MINSNDRFTRVSQALKTEFGSSTYVVGERVLTPTKYPCVWVVEMDTYPDQRYVKIDGSDSQRQSVFEVQAFSNLSSGGTSQVKKIIDKCTEEFLKMGYRCVTSMPVDNANDATIKRHVARYRRIIGGADTLPQTNE